jgi:hypothetical protein
VSLASRLERLAPEPDARRAVVDELRARLRRLEQRPPAAAPRLPPGELHARVPPRPLRVLEGSTATPWGATFSTPVARVGAVPLTLAALATLDGPRVAAELAATEPTADLLAGLRVVDLETTGLAGGTGTVAFLVGVGRFAPEFTPEFRIEQLLLGSPAHEAAMLDALDALLEGASLLVSFNGRSFDVPLLRTRAVLARRPATAARLASLPHLDLIAACRRLWRARTGDCRLVSLEEEVLRRRRVEDCPGALAPAAYRELLRTGDARLVEPIVRHNRDDVAGSLALLAVVLRVLSDPLRHAEDAGELVAAAEHRFRHAGASAALPVAERALELARAPDSVRRSLLLLARLRRRLGAQPDVEGTWRRYLSEFPRENRAYVELAKILEHRAKDLEAALALARAAPHPAAADVATRITRLRRRVAQAGGGSRGSAA